MLNRAMVRRYVNESTDLNDLFLHSTQGIAHAAKPWSASTSALEQACDRFMQHLAEGDKLTAICLAAGVARYAFTYVAEHHRDDVIALGCAFLVADPCMDGEPIEKQLLNVEAWLEHPTPETIAQVRNGIDPSRQMNIWDDDLVPSDDQMWVWMVEPTQLLSLAVVAGDSAAQDDDADALPYGWSWKACIARSTICALKAVTHGQHLPEEDLMRVVSNLI